MSARLSILKRLQPKRIVLIKPSALGDIVHALPVLGALRRRFPQAHIAWVVQHAYESLLRGHPDLNEVLVFERRGGPIAFLCLLAELRERQFDLAIDLQGLLRTGTMTAATLAPVRLGLEGAREGAGHFYTDLLPLPDRDTIHAVDRYWRVAESLDAGHEPKQFHFPVDERAASWAKETLSALPRPWLAVAPGARWETKRWPAEHFAILIASAQRRYGGSAIFVGGRDDAALANQIAPKLVGPHLNLTGASTLPQLVALLRQVDALIANDTGPLHIATALGTPVVAPYTCTQIVRHGPYMQLERARATNVPCAGSYLKRCDRLDCFRELTADRLQPVLAEVLMRWDQVSRTA
jgi:lipopolysaccharide heptosyltransferase II